MRAAKFLSQRCGSRLTLNWFNQSWKLFVESSSSSSWAMLDTLLLCMAGLSGSNQETLSWHLGLGNTILEIGACFSLVLPCSSGFQRRLGGEYDFNLWPSERWGPKTRSSKHVGSRTVEVLFFFSPFSFLQISLESKPAKQEGLSYSFCFEGVASLGGSVYIRIDSIDILNTVSNILGVFLTYSTCIMHAGSLGLNGQSPRSSLS